MAHKVLNLDLSKDPRGNPIVYGRVGDSDSQIVTVNVTDKLNKRDLSEYTIAFEGETSGGKTKVIDSENIISTPEGLKQGTFDYLFPNKAFAVAGEYKRAYFSFTNGNSRDTTGNFKFVVLKNADLTAEEAETVISEYNKLIEELRSQQSLAIDEMNQNFSAAQERIAELESQIEQALIDFENGNFWTKEESFNKEETSVNVIDQITGKEKVHLILTLDFEDKIAGSNVENPHNFGSQNGATPLKPTNSWNVGNQSRYNALKKLDGSTSRTTSALNGRFEQNLFSFNVLEYMKRKIGEQFFIDRGGETLIGQVSVLKEILTVINPAVWGTGSSANGNRLEYRIWVNNNSWGGTRSSTSSSISKLEYSSAGNASTNYISDDGFLYALAYTEPSDGVAASTLTIDYASLTLEVDLSAHEHIKSMIAAYCGKIVSPLEDQITDLTNRILALEGQ